MILSYNNLSPKIANTVFIGEGVTIGHSAVVHGCVIKDYYKNTYRAAGIQHPPF